MRLKIPYYAQTSEFSCGPACVLMIFKFLNTRLKMNRALEFEIWRQCNMIGVKGADPFGISVPLLDAGYDVHLLTERKRMIDHDLWRSRRQEYGLIPEDEDLAVFGVIENKKRAMSRGLTVVYSRLTVDKIAQHLYEGFIPLVLVHMGVVHQLDIPHWVVVTDVGAYHVSFNDPYPPKGGKNIRVSREEFQQMIGNVGTRIGLSPSVVFIRNRKSVKGPDSANTTR